MGVWRLLDDKTKSAIAISNYKSDNQLCLNIKIGDILDIIEETDEWFRGYIKNKPQKKGIFPKIFVRIYESEKIEYKDKSVTEIEGVLKEWTTIWLEKFDEIEHQKKNHCLMGYFKNGLNLKNVIVENRASIDEIRDLKKSNLSKILQGNSMLGLDVVAFDSNYNRLHSTNATTLFLYEELKKNSEINNHTLQSCALNSITSKDEQVNDSFLQKFEHKPQTVSNLHLAKPSSNYCLKVSLESLVSGFNFQSAHDITELCVNMYLYKENSPENSFYLCENAYFQMDDLINTKNLTNIQHSANSFQRTTLTDNNEKFVFFCDISEKDFEYTKKGYKLLLVVYSVKYTRYNEKDLLASVSKKFAGGLYDLGSNLCNLVYVSADIRNFQASMILYVSEFDSSIVSPKNIIENLNIKEVHDLKNSRSINKDMFFTLTFRIELFELSYKNIINKYGHIHPKICRKMNFPEIIMPDDYRNEFFITIVGAEFQKARNYELIINVVQIREENNKKIEDPVSFDEDLNQKDSKKYFFYKSMVYFKQDKPKWNEIVKISIPCGKKVKELKKLYLRFLVRSRSHDTKDKNKIIGISYLQITNEDGSVIKDMHCYLPINRIETEIEPIVMNGCFIPLKFQSFSINNWQNNPDKLKEFLEIKVKVVSTQLTQNVTLLNLLSFPTYENLDENHYQCLLGYLNELSSLKEEQTSEIVKFLQAILDKLIDILLDLKNKNEKINEKTIEFHRMSIQPRVFEILVFIFQIIENQSKYASFRSVIDAYLEKNFCITLVHKPILRILYQLLSATYEKYKSTRINGEFDRNSLSGNFETNEERLVDQKSFNSRSSVNSNYSEINDELTINAIKSIEYIFKFAFRSRELLSIYNKSNNINTKGETFNKDIEDIFKLMVEFTKLDPKKTSSIYESMADISPQAKITKIQSFILKNVVNLITILLISNRYSIESISKLYVGFFESRFVLQTQFLSKIIKTKLFEFSESRKILLEPMCKVIAHYLTYENDNECDKINQGIQTLGKITAELMNVLEKQKIKIQRKNDSALSSFIQNFPNTRRKILEQQLFHILPKLANSLPINCVLFSIFCRLSQYRIPSFDYAAPKIKLPAFGLCAKSTIKEEVIQVSTLLPCLSGIFLYLNHANSTKQLFGTIIISIMRLMNPQCFDMILDSSNQSNSIESYVNNCSSFIDKTVFKLLIEQKGITNDNEICQLKMVKLIHVCKTLMKKEIFPKNWYELLVLRNMVVFQVLNKISEKLIIYHFENFDSLNKAIWSDYFECMVLIAIDPCLQIEKFNRHKRSMELNKTDDLRIKVANEIKRMWYNLADNKSKFIPEKVSSFIKVSLLPVTEIQYAVIPLIFDMINCEYINKGAKVGFDDFMVPRLVITTIDQLLEFEKRDITFRNSFEKMNFEVDDQFKISFQFQKLGMNERFSSHIHLKKNKHFVKNVIDLYDLLVEYSTMELDSSDQLKTLYLNEILNFYGNIKRYDIYVKYIEKLRKIHKRCNNLVCAANTLKLHAELLYWTNEPLDPHLIHQSYQTEKIHKNLKEALFLELIEDYRSGLAWEKGFELSKILRGIYESEFDFDKLYKFLRQQADLCENILKVSRYECKYFLVGFYGKKFPKLFQNKRFVFRSEPLEQIMTFRQRVESWFPNSIRISHSYQVTEYETESLNHFIQVISVSPIYEPIDGFKALKISPKLIKYYEHNEVKKFKFSYRKDSVLNEEDPTLWWLVEKYVTISNPLPDVINFYPVIDENTVHISPIQNAINIVSERLEKLKESYNKIQVENEVSESDKLLIQGTIDPGVLGGLPKYKKFFLLTEPSENLKKSEFLKQLIVDTINWGEALLESAINHLPTDHLLNIIKNEQLPKLKRLFDLPTLNEYKKNGELHCIANFESTPKILSKTPSSSDQNSLNKSFLNKVQENYTGRTILSYFGVCDKPNTSSFGLIPNSSQRDSISSIKSVNSDEDFSNRKIILDEAISSKRPLRRFKNLNNSSTSNSNQSSRPISNLSGEDQNFGQFINNFDQNEIGKLHEDNFSDKAPPKPPKMKNIQIMSRDCLNHNSFIETFSNDQSKSSTSLNSVPFRCLSTKTISDSVLNKDQDI